MKLVILGGGESGVGAAILGKAKAYEVFVSDFGAITQNYKDILLKHKLDFEEGKHTEEKILQAHLVVKSPGIPCDAAIIKIGRAHV